MRMEAISTNSARIKNEHDVVYNNKMENVDFMN